MFSSALCYEPPRHAQWWHLYMGVICLARTNEKARMVPAIKGRQDLASCLSGQSWGGVWPWPFLPPAWGRAQAGIWWGEILAPGRAVRECLSPSPSCQGLEQGAHAWLGHHGGGGSLGNAVTQGVMAEPGWCPGAITLWCPLFWV